MAASDTATGIDEYLLERLMPVEGAIPDIPGIQMYGCSVPAGVVGGDLFEYINFQQRYDIEARIERARRLSAQALEGRWPEEWIEWFRARPDYQSEVETAFRRGAALDQVRIAENLQDLRSTAGVLLVDAQGHGIISAKIASTVHDTFHALMLPELDHHGKTTPELFEQLNIRLAHSVTARNALGRSELESAREIATMLYGEVRPTGHFRFVNFGHPPPLIFSAEQSTFLEVDRERMVQFLPLGLEVPEDHPDRKRYSSINFRQREAGYSDVADALIRPGDMLFLYTDGVYDGGDEDVRRALEGLIRQRCELSAKEICQSVMAFAEQRDRRLLELGSSDLIDDKTVFVIKRQARPRR